MDKISCRRFLELLHCKIEHPKLAITATQQVHRFQTRVRILPCALQLRHSLTKTPGIEKVLTQFESKLKIGRIPRHPLLCIGDEDFCAADFGGASVAQTFPRTIHLRAVCVDRNSSCAAISRSRHLIFKSEIFRSNPVSAPLVRSAAY